MSLAVIAKKDFEDGIRSRLLLALIALFVLSIGGLALGASGSVGGGEGAGAIIGLLGLSAFLAVLFLVPITGLVVSVKSVVREWELGSLNLLLSLPYTRGEVIVGKFIGRAGLLTVAILSGFLPAGVILAATTDGFPVLEYAVFVVMIILFGLVFVSVGIALSTLVSSETRATFGSVATFLVLYLWAPIFDYINGQLGNVIGRGSDLYVFIVRIQIFTVFVDGLTALVSLQNPDVANGTVAGTGFLGFGTQQTTYDAFYLQHWFAFVILALWLVVPLAIGYARFSTRDL